MSEQTITAAFEEKAIDAFVKWYRVAHPTINEAAQEARTIARKSVEGLTTGQVLLLLQEHEEWIYAKPQERYASDKMGLVLIGDITRRHLVRHVQEAVQARGIQAAYEVKQNER